MDKKEIRRIKKGLDLINEMSKSLTITKDIKMIMDYRSAVYYLFFRGEELREEFLFLIPVNRLEMIANALLAISTAYGTVSAAGEQCLNSQRGCKLNYSTLIDALEEIKGYLENAINKHKLKVFYSWQSDLPTETNRNFIEGALKKAIKSVEKTKGYPLEFDKDTREITGSPDISSTILNKIENSFVFVADVTLALSDNSNGRKMPNGNVLYETGYAEAILSDSNILLVCNTAYGEVEELPFDLRGKRVIRYNCSEASEDRKNERDNLIKSFEKAMESICMREIV